jgi:hypothetical protein
LCGLRISLLLLVAAASGGLGAQFLPDIDRFEVENVRLILLDGKGARVGVLKGELARKQRDGLVHVENAELRVERGEEAFVILADVFDYTPATNAFDCPEGMTADLPGGGFMSIPKGKGTIEYSDGLKFNMTVEGEARLREGPEGAALVDAKIMNPVISAEFKVLQVTKEARAGQEPEQSEMLEPQILTVTGDRGGECKLSLAQLPTVAENDKDGPSVVILSCFGDVSVMIRKDESAALPKPQQGGVPPSPQIAELHMLRRARMALEEGAFEVTSNLLSIRGRVEHVKKEPKRGEARTGKDDDQSIAVLADMAIDAEQNVALKSQAFIELDADQKPVRKGQDFNGRCAVLRYREFGPRREIRMEGEPDLTFDQGKNEDGLQVDIELRARDYIDVQVPDTGAGRSPAEIATELSGNASAKRLLDARMEWQISGRQVRLFSVLDEGATLEDVYNHAFDAKAGGYTPLLRVAGIQPDGGLPELQRASVFGSRSEGSYTAGRIFARVYGPEVVGVVHSDAPLADMLKIAMGLKEPPKDEFGNLLPLPRRDGRLTIRADTMFEFTLATMSTGGLWLAADGAVQLDHEPLPRDDSNLVTLTGEALALELRDGALIAAKLRAEPARDAIATLGYDLLICRDLDVHEQGDGLRSTLDGPGRLVVRDETSVAYFRRALDRLPKRPQDREVPLPDAAWLDFRGSFRADTSELSRTLEVDQPDFRLVDGDFEQPRAGRTAVDDLDELLDPTVVLLYQVVGMRVYAASSRATPGATPVNILRLEGDAYVNSRLDRFTASAREAIELGGSENQAAEDAPFSVVLLRDAHLHIEDAALFFGDYVRSGVFSYDGGWMLDAAERLEITFRPIESSGADDDNARAALTRALQAFRATPDRLHNLELAVGALRVITTGARPKGPAADQPWEALAEAQDAADRMRRALWLEMQRDPAHWVERAAATRSARRARALLSALIDVAGSGGLRGQFLSGNPNVPPLTLTMSKALFTFDGLGQIVDVGAEGPIVVSRDTYTIKGSSLRRENDGTLTLDGASITLPSDTGVDVTGVKSVALRQMETGGKTGIRRTMVTRVSGKDLKVRVRLAPLQK